VPDRQVRVSLIIDDHGSVKVLHRAGEESEHSEGKLKKLDSSVKGLGKSFGGLKGMIGMGLGAIGISGIGLGLESVISKTSEVATETEKFHAITGIGAQSSLDYTAALKARGIGAEAGGNAFKFLAKNIQLAERQEHTFATGQAKAAEKGKVYTSLLGVQANAFKELGINVKDFGKLNEQAKFELITKKFEGMTDGAQKTRLAVQLFGRGGTAMLPVLDKGALSLNHFDQMAKKFFPTLKGEGVKALEELKEKQDEGKMAWEGLEFTLGMKLIPVVTAVTGWFSKLILEVEKGHGTWGHLAKDLEGIFYGLKSVWQWVEKNIGAVKALELVLGGLAAFWAVGKITAFANAIRGLAGVVGGSAAAIGGERAAFGVAGGNLGAALAVGFGAALVLGLGKAIHEAIEAVFPGFLKQHSLAESTAAIAGGGSMAGMRVEHGELKPGRKGEWGINAMGGTHLGGKAVVGSGEVEVFDRLLHHMVRVHPGETLPGPPIHVHVEMNGRQLAEAVAQDPHARRRLSEEVAHETTRMAARR